MQQTVLPPLNMNDILQVIKTNSPTAYLTTSKYSHGRKSGILYRTVRRTNGSFISFKKVSGPNSIRFLIYLMFQ